MFACTLLIFLTLIYLISQSSVRHCVTRIPFVKGALRPLNNAHDEWVWSKIRKHIPSDKQKILNFGCGLNTLSSLLVKYGHDVTPLDIQDESIGDVPVVVYDGKNFQSISVI